MIKLIEKFGGLLFDNQTHGGIYVDKGDDEYWRKGTEKEAQILQEKVRKKGFTVIWFSPEQVPDHIVKSLNIRPPAQP